MSPTTGFVFEDEEARSSHEWCRAEELCHAFRTGHPEADEICKSDIRRLAEGFLDDL